MSAFFAQQPRAAVLLEACGSASFWAREIESVEYRVPLLPQRHVRCYRSANKTDRAEAKALFKAFRYKEFRPVSLKTLAQRAIAALANYLARYAWAAVTRNADLELSKLAARVRRSIRRRLQRSIEPDKSVETGARRSR